MIFDLNGTQQERQAAAELREVKNLVNRFTELWSVLKPGIPVPSLSGRSIGWLRGQVKHMARAAQRQVPLTDFLGPGEHHPAITLGEHKARKGGA